MLFDEQKQRERHAAPWITIQELARPGVFAELYAAGNCADSLSGYSTAAAFGSFFRRWLTRLALTSSGTLSGKPGASVWGRSEYL